jgi:hypothetical protein
MHSVKVHRVGISEQQAAEMIGRGLGTGCKVEVGRVAEVTIRKSALSRAKVTLREEVDGTVFEVRGQSPSFPLLVLTLRVANDRGIARRVAEAIDQSEDLRADG